MLSDIGTTRISISTAAVEDKISLLDVVIVLVQRARLIGTVTLVMAFIGLFVSMALPKLYTASTSILPPQQGSSAGAALMAQLGNLGSVASLAGGGLGLKNPNDLQVAILKSETVEDAMLDRFHLVDLYKAKSRTQARYKFEAAVDIENGMKDGLIRIFVTDRDPQRAAALANGYVEEFRKASANLAVTEASQRRLFFEQQLGQAKDNLAKAEEDLKDTQQTTGLLQVDSQTRAVIESVAQLRAQIAAKEVQIGAMRSFATGENPSLQIAEGELASLRAQEQKMGGKADDDGNELLLSKGHMQQAGLEYVRKLRDVKYFETIFDLLARQYEVAKVDEARQGALVQVVDRALVPEGRSSPKRVRIVLAATVLGLFCGVVWALAAEAIGRLLSDPEEQSKIEKLKYLVSRSGSAKGLPATGRPGSPV